ncbi:MAG: methyltransferase domain-containing protein [Myxococcales bacterium]|nr:methyltransferase domain-containing protein [Myxococcales bacterium]
MLDYTRTLHERPEVEMVPIAVEAALMQAVVRFRLLHPQAAERVHLPAPEADLAVRADPRRLVQLLVTVLDRAVRTSEATAPVRVTLTARESSVTLTITDQGLPLAGDPAKADDPLEWARLCMAVHRDEPPFTFAVARRLAEAMGGSLRIGSGPDGRGAEVQVNLLLADAHTLPFADMTFDRVLHVGATGSFGDPARALAEMARVARPGAPVVVVDEQLDPGRPHGLLRRAAFRAITFYERNPSCPSALLPPGVEDVQVRQISRFYYALRFRRPISGTWPGWPAPPRPS